MRVLNPLKAIKAKHQNSDLVGVAGAAKACIKFFFEQATVRKSGQRIVSRQIARFSFCNGSCSDFIGEISMAANAIDRQGDAQDERDKDNVVEFPFSVIHSKLKQMRAKVIDMRQDRSENGAPKKNNGIPCGRPAPVEPIGAEYAR